MTICTKLRVSLSSLSFSVRQGKERKSKSNTYVGSEIEYCGGHCNLHATRCEKKKKTYYIRTCYCNQTKLR